MTASRRRVSIAGQVSGSIWAQSTSAAAALLPAGFYYKTFKWPNWHLYEPTIRRMAGLGRASGEPDPDRYEEVSTHADVLVVGGGLAGLSAAVSAAEAGADTLLLAGSDQLGGALAWRSDPEIAALILRAGRCGLRQMTRTMAFGIYDHNLVCARESLPRDTVPDTGGLLRERLWKIRARAVIAACGAVERPMIFPNNDLPGVMLAGAADKYAHAFGVACGERVVIAANSDFAYQTAVSLRAAGINVIALVDRRPRADIDADSAHLRVIASAGIAKVGGRTVKNCTVISTDTVGSRPERLECDLILSAGGHVPSVHLHSQAGGKLRWMEQPAMFVPDGAAPGVWSAGACAGIFARDAAVESRGGTRQRPGSRRATAAGLAGRRGKVARRQSSSGNGRQAVRRSAKRCLPSGTSALRHKRIIARSSI